jgi:3-oxoacyl-[acyl-carrier-protein] synthase II
MRSGTKVVVSGAGAVSALGTGCDVLTDALASGRGGLRLVSRFSTNGFGSRFAGTWPGWDGRIQLEPGPEHDLASTARAFPPLELALPAAEEALQRARLSRADRAHAALIVGTCFGREFRDFHEIAEELARLLGIFGPCLTICTACASSTNAVGFGRDLIVHGHADAVLAGGVDVLLREVVGGFSALGVLSPEKCTPFGELTGTTLAEGAGFVVLERKPDAAARRVTPWAQVFGYGLSADAFQETTPDPTGAGIARAVRGALADAGWEAQSIDYVSAHATGTETNDRAECAMLEREIGLDVLVSGSKSMLGHAQGAAGVLELVLSLLAMQNHSVPPTTHSERMRPGCSGVRLATPGNRHELARGLKLSAAFGGANAVVAFGAVEETSERNELVRPRRKVVVSGIGLVGPCGGLQGSAGLAAAEHVMRGAVRNLDLARIDPSVDPRRLDPSSRYLTAATALCLKDAGLRRGGAAPHRSGLFAGATRMPEESARRCRDSIRAHGAPGTSATAFARMSVNSPAGTCAKLLGLRGPSTTVSVGEGSGLLSILLAAQWLSMRGDADRLVAAAVDELNLRSDTEGAVAVLLEPANTRGPEIAICGWGLAGSHDLAAAIDQALEGRGEPDGVVSDCEWSLGLPDAAALPLGFVDVSRFWGRAEAARSAVAFVIACERLRHHRSRSILVTSASGQSAAIALLITNEEQAR